MPGINSGINIGGVLTKKKAPVLSIELPQKLVITPDSHTESMDSLTGWEVSYGTMELNTTEKYSGNASIKMTSPVGTQTILAKVINWDVSADNGKSLRLWIYPHTAPTTTFDTVAILAGTDLWLGDYFNATCYSDAPRLLIQNQWNMIRINAWTVGAGSPHWDVFKKIFIQIPAKAGQSNVCSFDLVREGQVSKPAVIITFDDGLASVYTKAYPLLKAKNMVATAYVNSQYINTGQLTTAQLQELNSKGWDIANHGKSHTNFTTLTEEQIITDLTDCKTFLDGIGLTRASSHVAYPNDGFNTTVLSALTTWGAKTGRRANGQHMNMDYEGYPYQVLSTTPTSATTLVAMKGYIDVCVDRGTVCCLNMHGIADSNPTQFQWLTSQFSDLLDYIESKEIQTLTIDEYYRLYSGTITVNHK